MKFSSHVKSWTELPPFAIQFHALMTDHVTLPCSNLYLKKWQSHLATKISLRIQMHQFKECGFAHIITSPVACMHALGCLPGCRCRTAWRLCCRMSWVRCTRHQSRPLAPSAATGTEYREMIIGFSKKKKNEVVIFPWYLLCASRRGVWPVLGHVIAANVHEARCFQLLRICGLGSRQGRATNLISQRLA